MLQLVGLGWTYLRIAVLATQQPAAAAEARTVSGTAWQPDRTPMAAYHFLSGAWQWNVHGRLFGTYTREPTPKGGWGVGSMNWTMVSASRPISRGHLTFTTMGSLETLTLDECGYPRLFAAGPSCASDGFGEYQHAHPPIMELGARWTHALGESHALSLYAAVAGEPALGPVPYLHRASAESDPIAPISDHDLNAAHASRGVLTAAVMGGTWKVEGSLFNGAKARTDAVLSSPGPLESAAVRISWNPTSAWALQISSARIIAPSGHHANAQGILRVTTASASHHSGIGTLGELASTAAWSVLNDEIGSRHSILLESTLSSSTVHTLFLRMEAAHRFDARFTSIENPDGTHSHVIEATRHNAGQVDGGLTVSAKSKAVRFGLGARASLNFIPRALFPYYRSQTPFGFALFAFVSPATDRASHAHDP